MRRNTGIVGVIVVIVATACSSGGTHAVTLSHDQGPDVQPFTASGAAVDEAVMCPDGTMRVSHLESIDGDPIADEDWAGMFDDAMAVGGVAEMNAIQEWSCADGSGSFTIRHHNVFDFVTFEFDGQQNVGSWEIIDGSGSYADLSGSGEVILDLDAAKVLHNGDVG